MKLAAIATALVALNGLTEAERVVDEHKKLKTIADEAQSNINLVKGLLTNLETHSDEAEARLQDFKANYGPRVAVRTAEDVFYGNIFQSTPFTSAGMSTKSAYMGANDILWVVDANNGVYTKDTTSQGADWVKIAEGYKHVFPWGHGFFGILAKPSVVDGRDANVAYIPDKANPSDRHMIPGMLRNIVYDGVKFCGIARFGSCRCNGFNTQTLTVEQSESDSHGKADACFPTGSGKAVAYLSHKRFLVKEYGNDERRRVLRSTDFRSISGTEDMVVGVGKNGRLFYAEQDEGDLKFGRLTKIPNALWGNEKAAIEITVFAVPFPKASEPSTTTLPVGQVTGVPIESLPEIAL